jgi:hypothetical protein
VLSLHGHAGEKLMTQRLMWILWPAFLVAGIAEGVFFSLFDPLDMHVFSDPIELNRTATYSIGFFLFWVFGAASSALTCFLQRSPFEVNRCPLPPVQRPEGCPKRDEANGCC